MFGYSEVRWKACSFYAPVGEFKSIKIKKVVY